MPTSILIVEDDELLSYSLMQLCQQHAFSVSRSSCPHDAIALMRSHSFDLILLDQHFPTCTGYDVVDYLHASDTHTKVLMLSQHCRCTQRVAALRMGVDDFVSKPFHPDELLLKIEKLIQHKHDIHDEWICTKRFKLNAYSGDLWQDDHHQRLRHKEFEILALLVRHRNSVLTKESIIEQVWSADTMPIRTTVDVHVRRIRLSIKDYNKTVIKTVYGIGYQYCE